MPITQTVPPEWLMRADVLVDAEHGALSRADILRRALGIGLQELERQQEERWKRETERISRASKRRT